MGIVVIRNCDPARGIRTVAEVDDSDGVVDMAAADNADRARVGEALGHGGCKGDTFGKEEGDDADGVNPAAAGGGAELVADVEDVADMGAGAGVGSGDVKGNVAFGDKSMGAGVGDGGGEIKGGEAELFERGRVGIEGADLCLDVSGNELVERAGRVGGHHARGSELEGDVEGSRGRSADRIRVLKR